MKTKINLYNYVADKHDTHEILQGVYHDEGMRIASDGHILLVLNNQTYESELEQKVVKKNGSFIEYTKYPKWRTVIPSEKCIKKEFKPFKIDIESYRNWLKDKRNECTVTTGKKIRFSKYWTVRVGNTYFKCETFDKMVQAIEFLKSDTILVSSYNAFMTNENGTVIAMCMNYKDYQDQIEPVDIFTF